MQMILKETHKYINRCAQLWKKFMALISHLIHGWRRRFSIFFWFYSNGGRGEMWLFRCLWSPVVYLLCLFCLCLAYNGIAQSQLRNIVHNFKVVCHQKENVWLTTIMDGTSSILEYLYMFLNGKILRCF